jgi:hypothetical protein
MYIITIAIGMVIRHAQRRFCFSVTAAGANFSTRDTLLRVPALRPGVVLCLRGRFGQTRSTGSEYRQHQQCYYR